MLTLLAHRGLWNHPAEQNSFVALARALDAGLGVETDVRDHDGQLVISHDPASSRAWRLTNLLEYYQSRGSTGWLALNVKSDGLAEPLGALLMRFAITNYFVFDMAVPDMVTYERGGIAFFTRQSELEPQPALYESSRGIWLDAFHSRWYDMDTVVQHLDHGKHVALVSDELHCRDRHSTSELVVRLLNCLPRSPHCQLMLCTDYPLEYQRISRN